MAQATGSNRLAELFLAPYTVAPAKYKSTIMEYAQLVGAERLGELVSTEEILVLGAIVKCYDLGKIAKSLILVGDIADTINQELSYKEQWTNRRVVEVATRLGFRKKRTNRGTAIIYDSKLIERLKKDVRYKPAFQPEEIEAPFSGNASQSSQSSPTENWLQGSENLDKTES